MQEPTDTSSSICTIKENIALKKSIYIDRYSVMTE